MELNLSWSKECIIFETSITFRVAGNPKANPTVLAAAAIQTTRATF